MRKVLKLIFNDVVKTTQGVVIKKGFVNNRPSAWHSSKPPESRSQKKNYDSKKLARSSIFILILILPFGKILPSSSSSLKFFKHICFRRVYTTPVHAPPSTFRDTSHTLANTDSRQNQKGTIIQISVPPPLL